MFTMVNVLSRICWQLAPLYTVFEPCCIYFTDQVCFILPSSFFVISFQTQFAVYMKTLNFFYITVGCSRVNCGFWFAQTSSEFLSFFSFTESGAKCFIGGNFSMRENRIMWFLTKYPSFKHRFVCISWRNHTWRDAFKDF